MDQASVRKGASIIEHLVRDDDEDDSEYFDDKYVSSS